MADLPNTDDRPKMHVRARNEIVHLVHPSYINFSLLSSTATQDDVEIAIANARGTLSRPSKIEQSNSSNEIRKGPCLKSTFPFKLHEILSNPTLSDIITWLPHGRAWHVINTKAFSDRVLSSYFKQTKYTSFIRQINGWGFHRVKIGPDRNTYYHELFLRGMPHLAQFMRRGRSSITSINNCSQNNDGSDPDFYMISKVYPLPPFNDQPSVDEESTPQPGSDGHVRLKAPRSTHEESNREPDHLLVDDRGAQQHDHDADHFEDDGRQPGSNPHRVKDDRLQAPRSSHAGSHQRHDNQQREFGLQQHDAFVRHFDEHARQPQDQPSAMLWRQNDAQYSIPHRVEDGHTYNRLHAPRSSHPGSYQRHDHLQDDWSPQQHDHSVTSVHHTEEPHSLQPLEQQSSLFWSQNHSQYEGREVKMGSDGMPPCPPPRVHPLTNQPSRRQQQDNCGPLPIADGIGSLDRTSFVFDQQSAEETSAMLQRLLF